MNTPRMIMATLLACGIFATGPALAEGDGPAGKQQWCQDNPVQCQEKKTRREAWCKENPDACEKARARREEMRKQCAADPVACEQRKEERRKRHEAFRKQCEADPVACEEKKSQWRQRKQEQRQDKPAE